MNGESGGSRRRFEAPASLSVGERWMDRLPDSPRLQLLGPGLTNIASESYRRHSELVHTTFAQLDWSAHEFVGFRCEEEYPIWGSGYCMTFDYSNPDRK